MTNGVKTIEDSIFWNPQSLLSITNLRVKEAIDSYLPYSTAMEIECDQQPSFDVNCFTSIPDIMAVDCDTQEQRFRIPPGLKGMICLNEICKQLKVNSFLNTLSGIHYHVDMTGYVSQIDQRFISVNKEWILAELDSWGYKGTFNSREVGFSHHWVRIQKELQTAEFRLGEMTFEYALILKRMIHCNSIVRKMKAIALGGEIHLRILELQEELKNLTTEEAKQITPEFSEIKQIINKRVQKVTLPYGNKPNN